MSIEAVRMKALVKAQAAEGLWMQEKAVLQTGVGMQGNGFFATLMEGSSGKVVLDWTDV